jgi:hypothetical protein
MILIHLWLILLALLTVGMSVACLKYCATNRDARSESTFSTFL